MEALPLDDMALFVEIARAGNFSRASTRLGVPNATLSRRIAAMERRLGVRLFERSTRRVALTDAAQRFFERCAPLVDEARLAHEALRDSAAQPTGHLRVSMPVDFGVIYLGSCLPDFLRRYPAISIDLDLSPRFVDLFAGPVDIAFRLGNVQGDGLVARRIGMIEQGLYAAPGYLDIYGRPRLPMDLTTHRCLYIGSAKLSARWTIGSDGEDVEVPVRGPVGLNNMNLTRTLAENSLGVALLPVLLGRASERTGKLEAVLPQCTLPGWPIYAVTTSRMQSAAARAFIDFVASRLGSEQENAGLFVDA